ncbi:MAG: LPD38 domain-containing protein [Novosphingobium sp.]
MSFDLYAKTRFLEGRQPGRNLVLASGTPITNTMAELFSVSRYLQQGELEKRGLGHFDAWAGAFGDTVTALEQDAAGGYKPVTRFAQFVNVPELSVMVRQVMDVVGATELRQYVSLPNLKGGGRNLITVEMTPEQERYKATLQSRMEAIKQRSGPPQKGDDILLSVIGDGRKAAIDYRLIDASAPKEAGSKLERMIEEVARRHKEFTRTAFHKPLPGGAGFSEKPETYGPATQMIFSDFGINGDFPVHKYIKSALIERGIPASQIALIQDFKTHIAKQRLFNDMNEGKVRVLIGSVAKMGTGVNARKRLRALHNMDAQWYPANDTQRNGRIIRQGNMNPEVEILDYATNGTYDSTMWGLMAKKARFIEGFMRGDPTMRDMEDLGEASQYEQASAMTTSDPRIMDLTEWKQELEKIERRQMAHEREQQSVRMRLASARSDVAEQDRLIPLIKSDIESRQLQEGEEFSVILNGETFEDRTEYGAALMAAMDALVEKSNGKELREGVGSFGGFPLVAEVSPRTGGEMALSFYVKRAGGRETRVDMGTDARGLVTRLTNAIKGFDKELTYSEDRKAEAEQRIADFEPKLGATFDDGGKGDALRTKIRDLESTLKAESEARDAALKAQASPEAQQSIPETAPQGDRPADIRTALQEQLAGLRLADKVKVRLVDTLGGAAGEYRAQIVSIATDTPQSEVFTLNHEAMHALRALGLFKNEEWAILSAKARRDTMLMRSVRQRYEAGFRKRGLTGAALEEAIIEEAVADQFARYQDGRYKAEGTTDRLFKMLRQFFEAVRNVFAGRGLRTAEGVMQDVARGEVGGLNSQAALDGSAGPLARSIPVERSAKNLVEARDAAAAFVGRPIENAATGLVATVSRNNLLKMTSGKAVQKSTSAADHARAVANVDRLFEGAVLQETHADRNGEPTIAAIHRYVARMETNEGGSLDVKMTVKETTGPNQPNPLYTVETLEVEPPSVSETSAPEQDRNVAPEGSDGNIGDSEPDSKFSMPERDDLVALGGSDPTWKGKVADAFDRWRTAMQDRYLPLLKVQRQIEEQTGKPLPVSRNPYMGEELMTGRIGSRLERLAEDHVQPLFDAMHAAGVSVEELESFLYARHAPERNARIAEINPEFTDGEGSGMTDLEAAAIMSRIRKAGKMEAMERLANRVDRIRDDALDYRVQTGLISKDEAKEWRSTYQFYVPLRGFKETGTDAIPERMNRSGGGINVRGRESKQAFGRRSQADSPLAYTILQAEEAIIRGETNLVAQRFYNLAKANPDPEFWTINKTTARKRMNEDSGLVESYLTHNLLAEDKDWTVSAKINGREVRVTMNKQNVDARRLADAMRNLTQHQLDWVTLHMGKVNRFLSAVNTSYNPEFIITNAFRDLQTATFNLSGDGVKGIVRGTLKDYRKALAASAKGAFGKHSGEWGKWYDEFVMNGGRVYFNKVENVEQIKKRIQGAADMAKAKAGEGGPRLQAKRLFLAGRDMIENLNNGVENAVRLSVYKNAREAGLTPAQAASIAKNVTVNFNRRGTAGPAMNAAYLFFNASVQGSARIIMALRSPRVRKMVAGVMIAGAAMEILNALVTAIDDDGESIYDKIPAFEKSRNIIIMSPDGKSYFKIPMPYGYNAFFEAGRSTAEIARRGGDRWKETMAQFVGTVADAFNPIGGSDSLLRMISPTITDPLVDLELNRDFTGKPIMPNQPAYGPEEPDNQRYFNSVGPHWRAITDFFNTASGGDEVMPGAIDVSPETLEYLAGTVVGSAGGFLDRIATLVGKGFDESEEVSANDIPLARKVVGGKPSWVDKASYYDRVNRVEQEIGYVEDYLDAGKTEEAQAYAEKNRKILTLESAVKQAKKDMREVRKARREIEAAKERGQINDATYRQQKEVVDRAEKLVVTEFNTAWNQAMQSRE